jgi:hypothetical protein
MYGQMLTGQITVPRAGAADQADRQHRREVAQLLLPHLSDRTGSINARTRDDTSAGMTASTRQ